MCISVSFGISIHLSIGVVIRVLMFHLSIGVSFGISTHLSIGVSVLVFRFI